MVREAVRLINSVRRRNLEGNIIYLEQVVVSVGILPQLLWVTDVEVKFTVVEEGVDEANASLAGAGSDVGRVVFLVQCSQETLWGGDVLWIVPPGCKVGWPRGHFDFGFSGHFW